MDDWAEIEADKTIGYLQRTNALGSMAYIPEFKREMANALRAERERCAKVADEIFDTSQVRSQIKAAHSIAAAIRENSDG